MAVRRNLLVFSLAGAALASLAASSPPHVAAQAAQAQVRLTQVDTSRFPRVTVYVSVTDPEGEPFGIDPARIVLRENGEEVTIDDVRGLGEAEPLSSMLVIDVSGSMNLIGKLQAAQEAARAYVAQMRPGDQAGVVTFNTRARLVQPLTTDRPALTAAIDGLQASDDTALYDGLAAGIQALAQSAGRRAVLLLSDGMDNSSQVSLEQALEGIGPEGLSISTIGLGDPDRAAGEWAGLDVESLQHVAAQTGGSYTAVTDAEALRALYLRLGRELQSEFVLSYLSPSSLRDGVDRSLSVALAEASALPEVQAEYNPGGLVPEVPQPAPWPVFLAALGILAALVVIPMTGRAILRRPSRRAPPSKKAGRRGSIRLEEPKPRRVRMQ